MTDLPLPRRNGTCPREIHAPCVPYGRQVSFMTLAVSTRSGQIDLDPHTTGACKVTIDEEVARVLRYALIKWLG